MKTFAILVIKSLKVLKDQAVSVQAFGSQMHKLNKCFNSLAAGKAFPASEVVRHITPQYTQVSDLKFGETRY